MNVGIFDRQIWAQAEIDELILARQQDFFDKPQCPEQLERILCSSVFVEDSQVIDVGIRSVSAAIGLDRAKEKSGCYGQPMFQAMGIIIGVLIENAIGTQPWFDGVVFG